MYRPDLKDQTDLRSIIANNDIIIFDHGIHYAPETDPYFAEQMTTLLEAYVQYGEHLRLLAWRQTTAQHFSSPPGGYYSQQPDPERKCAPIQEEYVLGHNRLFDMMKDVMHNNSKIETKLTILTFREYTSQFYDMHPGQDCNHFCSSPSMWLPLWRSLRNAIENILD